MRIAAALALFALLAPGAITTRDAELARIQQRLENHHAQFENPAALVPFFEALSRPESAETPIHILQFGDSHTASDDLVNAMRTALQARYGAGGPGFTLPGHPFRGYRRFDVSGFASDGWTTEGTLSKLGDGREGLSGISITARSPGQFATLHTSGASLAIHYLQQPAGGAFELLVDGQPIAVVSTKGDLSAGIYRYQPSPGDHDYRINTLSTDPLRLFGWTSDAATGLTLETLGINGAQAGVILNWDQPIWRQEVASRQPALLILQYGTNEANSVKWDAEQYTADLKAVFVRARSAAPLASLLLLGPPDCGRAHPLAHLDEVIAIQRRVARQLGVSFWNWRARMGGPRSVVQWVRAGFGQPDYIHLTGAGYRLIGQTLVDDLEAEHARFLAAPALPL